MELTISFSTILMAALGFKVLTIDKACFNVIYTKKFEAKNINENNTVYYIDGVDVGEEVFNQYRIDQEIFMGRMAELESKVLAKTNLLKWIDKHFKMDAKFIDVVDARVQQIYDFNVQAVKDKMQGVSISDLRSVCKTPGAWPGL